MCATTNIVAQQSDSVSLIQPALIDNTPEKKKFFNSKILPYYINDIYLIGGLNQSGIFWSYNHRDLSYSGGFQANIESYVPLMRKAFFNYGFGYAQRRFNHHVSTINGRKQVQFVNHIIEIPLYFSYELPIIPDVDFRFLLGTQLSFRLNSSQRNPYPELTEMMPNQFIYDVAKFKNFDFGMLFGLSGEYKDFFLRFRSYVGVVNLTSTETGMFNSFYIDFGYFFLRNWRKK